MTIKLGFPSDKKIIRIYYRGLSYHPVHHSSKYHMPYHQQSQNLMFHEKPHHEREIINMFIHCLDFDRVFFPSLFHSFSFSLSLSILIFLCSDLFHCPPATSLPFFGDVVRSLRWHFSRSLCVYEQFSTVTRQMNKTMGAFTIEMAQSLYNGWKMKC